MLKIYDFKCPKCSVVTEKLVRNDDDVFCDCAEPQKLVKLPWSW